MKAKIGLAALAITVSISSTASAGYVQNKTQWDRLEGKSDYIAGVMDGLLLNPSNDKNDLAFNAGIQACLIDLEMGASDLVRLVSRGYVEPATWSYPPSSVLQIETASMCRPYINRERIKHGLAPWRDSGSE